MKKLAGNIFAGIIVTVAGGVLLQVMLQNNSKDKDINPPKKSHSEIHYQEIQKRKFQTEIHSNTNGKKSPTTVWGYLDLDEGKHNKNNADFIIRVPFFDKKSGYFIRSISSKVEIKNIGKCRDIPQKPNGSKEMTLSLNTEYCVKTNQGRIASIMVHQILTSWGKYASINVHMTIRSYSL